MQTIADAGGVANLAGGGIAGLSGGDPDQADPQNQDQLHKGCVLCLIMVRNDNGD